MSDEVIFICDIAPMQVALPVETFVSHEASNVFAMAAGEQGPAGAKGDKGDKGDQGLPGLSGASYMHTQAIPQSVWAISHNLGRYPSVTVVDSAGSVVVGNIEYVSNNSIVLTFSAAFGGSAYLN